MTRAQWTTVQIGAIGNRTAITNALFSAGAEALQEVGDDVVTHIADADTARIEALVRAADPGAVVTFAATPDVDWSAAWRSRIGAHRLGAFVVTPPWLAQQFSSEERIVIEPAMAFGTGEHETTRGVVRLMQSVVRAGDTVADLGAGSAVLAIAAAKLGAGRVVAIEVDPDAIGNAEQNVAQNDVADRVSVLEGDAAALLPLIAPVRVVLANIISAVLLDLLPVIDESLTPDGVAILSGLLVDERPVVEHALRDAGWRTLAIDEEGIWWSISVARP